MKLPVSNIDHLLNSLHTFNTDSSEFIHVIHFDIYFCSCEFIKPKKKLLQKLQTRVGFLVI